MGALWKKAVKLFIVNHKKLFDVSFVRVLKKPELMKINMNVSNYTVKGLHQELKECQKGKIRVYEIEENIIQTGF
jgi:hypothetical protein